jgi:hypothetical protein
MKEVLFWLLVISLAVLLLVSCSESEWYAKQQQENMDKQRALETPHVIREADGCKVYQFEAAGVNHYFTRCINSKTSTERHYKECYQMGKARNCSDKTEVIADTLEDKIK